MNLTSCENCGVVLDRDRLDFPHDIEDEYGGVDAGKGTWDENTRDFVPFVNCPVCGNEVKA